MAIRPYLEGQRINAGTSRVAWALLSNPPSRPGATGGVSILPARRSPGHHRPGQRRRAGPGASVRRGAEGLPSSDRFRSQSYLHLSSRDRSVWIFKFSRSRDRPDPSRDPSRCRDNSLEPHLAGACRTIAEISFAPRWRGLPTRFIMTTGSCCLGRLVCRIYRYGIAFAPGLLPFVLALLVLLAPLSHAEELAAERAHGWPGERKERKTEELGPSASKRVFSDRFTALRKRLIASSLRDNPAAGCGATPAFTLRSSWASSAPRRGSAWRELS